MPTCRTIAGCADGAGNSSGDWTGDYDDGHTADADAPASRQPDCAADDDTPAGYWSPDADDKPYAPLRGGDEGLRTYGTCEYAFLPRSFSF